MKKTKETTGITLVALVITIIILLILAGISIAVLTGDNGLFGRAKQAKQNTLDAQNNENLILASYGNEINETISGDRSDTSDLGNITELFTEKWTGLKTGTSDLKTGSQDFSSDLKNYFEYDESTGKLTCKKSGWYMFNSIISTYNSSGALSRAQTNVIVDGASITANTALGISISQEEMNTNSLNLYLKENSVIEIQNNILNTMNSYDIEITMYKL